MPCLLTDQNFVNIFWKGSPKEHFHEIISKSDKCFKRRRILKHFPEVNTMQKASHPMVAMFFDRSKFRQQFLKRVTQGTILWNYSIFWQAVLEKKIFNGFLHVRIVQNAPILQGHVYSWIKILQTIFEKGHPRNNPVKLFQNLTSGFRGEEFWRISVKSTQWKKPPPFFDGSKFLKQISKRVTQGTILWNYSILWPAVSEKKSF